MSCEPALAHEKLTDPARHRAGLGAGRVHAEKSVVDTRRPRVASGGVALPCSGSRVLNLMFARRRPVLALVIALSGCARSPIEGGQPPSAPPVMLGSVAELFHDVFVAHACAKLEGSFLPLPHPQQPGASSGTIHVTSCVLKAEPQGAVRLAIAGVLWEGDRRPSPDAYRMADALALGWRGELRAVVTVREDAAGLVRIEILPDSNVVGEASPVGPLVARPRSIGAEIWDAFGWFVPDARREITAQGGAALRASLRSRIDVVFNPETLQPWIEVNGVNRLPFIEPRWLVNERIALGPRMIAIRGPFPPAASVGARTNNRTAAAQVALACAEDVAGVASSVETGGTEGVRGVADRSVFGYVAAAGETTISLPRACRWVAVYRTGGSGADFDALLRETR